MHGDRQQHGNSSSSSSTGRTAAPPAQQGLWSMQGVLPPQPSRLGCTAQVHCSVQPASSGLGGFGCCRSCRRQQGWYATCNTSQQQAAQRTKNTAAPISVCHADALWFVGGWVDAVCLYCGLLGTCLLALCSAAVSMVLLTAPVSL